MDTMTKVELVKAEPFEEAITEKELVDLFETKEHPSHYIGLEISGMPHIGHLLFGGKKVNDLHKAGVRTQVLLADWHTVANRKFGGDWEKIRRASEFYRKMFEVYCPGTRIVLGSDLYKDNNDYWRFLMDISVRTTIARATRTLIIEGRSQTETLHVSQYIYPMMQTADIRALGADIPHAGMDQRRVHVLAKEIFKEMKIDRIVPVHHHLMPSMNAKVEFGEGESKEERVAQMKMSKSKPGSFISVVATEDEVRKALNGAWCPERVVDGNPVLLLCRHIIIPIDSSLKVERRKEHGGDVEYRAYKDIEGDFRDGRLHPADLKAAVAVSLSRMLEPVRREFTGRNRDLMDVFRQG